MENISLNTPRVSIIILNWNGWIDTIECLESLYQIDYKNYDVIVVENGSNDESLQKIENYCLGKIKINPLYCSYNPNNKPISILNLTKKEAKSGVKPEKNFLKLANNRKLILISLKKNRGFTGGNNIGCTYALKTFNPDYILLLNNDTVVEKGFLNDLVEVSESSREIGIVGPEILNYKKPHKNQFEVISYNTIKEPTDVDWVSGCAFLMKTKLIKKIGLLDPLFFCFYEETDYIERSKIAGFKIFYVPKAHIFHKLSATAKRIPKFIFFYMARNLIIFNKKHSNTKEFEGGTFNYIRKGIRKYLKTPFFVTFLKAIFSGVILSSTRKKVKSKITR